MNTVSKRRSLLAACGALAIVLTGCGSEAQEASSTSADVSPTTVDQADGATTEADSGDTTPMDRSALSQRESDVLDDIITAVGERPDVWAGFSLADLPTIVPIYDDSDTFTSGFAFFHSNPQAAGDAVPLGGVDGLPDLHYIPQVTNVPQPQKFSFEIDADVGGVPTYVFPADDDLPSWPAVFVHEGFHVAQIRFWDQGRFIDQQRYDIDVRNYELAVIEDRALFAAYRASGDEAMTAIEHFLALRATRLSEFPNVAVDGQQESIEGSAEWFEWQHTGRFAVDLPWFNPTSGNLEEQVGFAAQEGALYAGVAPLQRFYYSGATQLELLERLEFDWQPRLEQGDTPAALLAEAVPIDPSDLEALVADARQSYDPEGDAIGIADIWVNAEPSDEPIEGYVEEPEELGSFVDAPLAIITCLGDYGLTPEQVDSDPSLLTAEIAADCVGGFQDRAFECIADAGFDPEVLDYEGQLPPEVEACFE